MWRVATGSDAGTKYRQPVTPATPEYARGGVRMEDAVEVHAVGRHGLVVCVADGHGSLKTAEGCYVGGRECAAAACRVGCQLASQAVRSREQRDVPDRIFRACQAAAVGVVESLRPEPSAVTGTTLSMLTLTATRSTLTGSLAWVGDSLGVLVRGATVLALGRAHSVRHPLERARMLEAGASIFEEERYFQIKTAGEGGRSSKVRIAVSRSLGHGAPIEHAPEVVTFAVEPGDRIALATDGLWDACDVQRAGAALAAAATEAAACDALLDLARSYTKPRDNASVVCVFVAERGMRADTRGARCAVM